MKTRMTMKKEHNNPFRIISGLKTQNYPHHFTKTSDF